MHASRCAAQHVSATKVGASHEGKLFFDMVEHPVASFQTLHGNSFDLANCIQMQLHVNPVPAVLAKCHDILNRTPLLLPARICERFCYRPLGKIKRIGKTERDEISGETSEILNALVKQLFHLTWDIDRVPYRFHVCVF